MLTGVTTWKGKYCTLRADHLPNCANTALEMEVEEGVNF